MAAISAAMLIKFSRKRRIIRAAIARGEKPIGRFGLGTAVRGSPHQCLQRGDCVEKLKKLGSSEFRRTGNPLAKYTIDMDGGR